MAGMKLALGMPEEGHAFVWLKTVRERGPEALLERGKTDPNLSAQYSVLSGKKARSDD